MSTGRVFVVVNKCLIGSPRRAPADGFLELQVRARVLGGSALLHGKSDLIALSIRRSKEFCCMHRVGFVVIIYKFGR
jgi:hypothetical protein